MTDDKICVFKDSDLKNFGKSICEINIEEREIKNIDSHRKDDPTSLWLKKHCEKKYAFALLANIPDDNRDESWITIQVGSGNKILNEIISELVRMQPGSAYRKFPSVFHENTPEFDYAQEVECQKYRFIAEQYKKFKILIFDNDLFLEQQRGNIPKDILDGFSEEQKAQVVETLFAYMTRAYFWNKSPRNNMIEDRISKEIINGNIKIQKLGDKKVIFKGKIIDEY